MEGFLSQPPRLEAWKSATRAAGMSLEDYVMKMIKISEFDRDMIGGIGLVETRKAGPVAMVICSQAYLHRFLDEEEWGGHNLAWKGFASIKSGYELEIDGVSDIGRDYAQYLRDSIEGGTEQGKTPLFTATDYNHYLNNKELYSHASAAKAAQDMSWRLIAGYQLADMAGDEYVTFFLNDGDSNWWNYHEDLMDAGLVHYETNAERAARYAEATKDYFLSQNPNRYIGNEELLINDVNNFLRSRQMIEFSNPSTMDGVTEMIETSHQYGNQYESNPTYENFVAFDRITDRFNFESLPDGQEVVVPRYAGWVYDHAADLSADPPFTSAEAYRAHYHSLVFMYNKTNEQAFASYYFPTEDTVNLPNY